MLNDALISATGHPRSANERRRSVRASAPPTELVVLWHHDMETAIRYPLVDMNDGGGRILTATPLVEGMTGIAMNLLPQGKAINRPCSVRWVRPREQGRGYEAGLRFM